MTVTKATRERLSYAGARLDRAAISRKDPTWVSDRLSRPDTVFVPVWRDRNLVAGMDNDATPSADFRSGPLAAAILKASSVTVFLGLDGDTAVFAVDIDVPHEHQAVDLVGTGAFVDLRQVGPHLSGYDAGIMAYARAMAYWHRRQRFCASCGAVMKSRDGGHIRACTNGDCGRQTFPRTDPAVIMLVEHCPLDGGTPRCLLGHHVRLPAGLYSTLAGFVEPGESLEETVVREVFEETGVVIGDVAYQGSQPWPFPASIMLGFRAQAASTAIRLDDDELDEARWFTPKEVRNFGEWGDDGDGPKLPRRDSIARFLVESWLDATDT
ncbi:MAG: NAD(+) diphosphatase [Alphaproteobacteria bacterium]|nr:NAD(+) diphosphatase [Alphaproteobacteria bacterium]